MHCPHCEMRIKKTLESVKGVKSAKVDHKKGTAVAEVDESVTIESLIEAVNATELYKAQT